MNESLRPLTLNEAVDEVTNDDCSGRHSWQLHRHLQHMVATQPPCVAVRRLLTAVWLAVGRSVPQRPDRRGDQYRRSAIGQGLSVVVLSKFLMLQISGLVRISIVLVKLGGEGSNGVVDSYNTLPFVLSAT